VLWLGLGLTLGELLGEGLVDGEELPLGLGDGRPDGLPLGDGWPPLFLPCPAAEPPELLEVGVLPAEWLPPLAGPLLPGCALDEPVLVPPAESCDPLGPACSSWALGL